MGKHKIGTRAPESYRADEYVDPEDKELRKLHERLEELFRLTDLQASKELADELFKQAIHDTLPWWFTTASVKVAVEATLDERGIHAQDEAVESMALFAMELAWIFPEAVVADDFLDHAMRDWEREHPGWLDE